MDNIDSNDMVHCPYNKAHKMLRKKLQQHILKCRVYYKDEVELLVCPFNKAHLIPEPEYVHHTKSCIDRKIIAHYQHSAPAELNEETRHAKIECEENWDNDDVPDYDPDAYVSKAKVVREAKGLFPAQRKAFIKEERKRLLNEQSDEDNDNEEAPTKSTSTKTSTTSTSKSYRATPYNISNRRR
ncbi:hypothetical protein ACLKA7_015083 [Drosophila subpalustris]